MEITWDTIRPFSVTILLLLLPKAISYYKSFRAGPSNGIAVRPVPRKVSRALLILLATALAFVIKSLPIFSPENIFDITQSRLQIPTDVLFTRLSGLRPMGLTSSDEVLRSKFNSMDSRLLFFQFGPDVLANCLFCNADDRSGYLYYSIPSILAPHLFNLCVLAAATSGLFTGKECAVWRTTATIAAAGAAIADVYLLSSYNYQGNSRTTRLEDIDTFFWKSRVYRFLAIAAIDGIIGWVLYLSSTNRAFTKPLSTEERVASSAQILGRMKSKINALAILQNTVYRDERLRAMAHNFWVHEGVVMGEVFEDREVVECVQDALESRVNMPHIMADADMYAKNVVGSLLGGMEEEVGG